MWIKCVRLKKWNVTISPTLTTSRFKDTCTCNHSNKPLTGVAYTNNSYVYIVFQLKQGMTYASEHLKPDGKYILMVQLDEPGLLRGGIQSRYSNQIKHKSWMRFNEQDILGWYCTCKGGTRTLNPCVHLSSIIWYLGLGRHNNFQGHIQRPTQIFRARGMTADFASESEDSENEDYGAVWMS